MNRGVYSSKTTESASAGTKILGTIINNSKSLVGLKADSPVATLSENINGKTVVYLYKEASSFRTDMDILKVDAGRNGILWEIDGSKETRVFVSLENKKIQIEFENAVIDIVYVRADHYNDDTISFYDFARVDEERQRIIEENRKRAEKSAWEWQVWKIKHGFRTMWSTREVSTLLDSGKLNKYVATYKFHVEEYPELALSHRNIILRKQKSR